MLIETRSEMKTRSN